MPIQQGGPFLNSSGKWSTRGPSHRRYDFPTQFEELLSRLNEIQKIGSIGCWRVELPSQCVWWSGEMFRLYGKEEDASVPTYEEFVECVHPEDRSIVDRAYRLSLAEGEPYKIEFRIIHPDGKLVWIESRVQPVKKSDGSLECIEGTNQDITLRKENELRIQENEETLRTAFESMREGVLLVSHHRVIRYVNPAFLKHLGVERGQILGRTIDQLSPSVLREKLRFAIEQIQENGDAFTAEVEVASFSGMSTILEWSVTRSGVGFQLLTHDVTHQRKVEEDLRRKEERLSAFFETSNVGMSEWSFDGIPLRFNQTCCQMLGYTTDEFAQVTVQQIVSPDEWELSTKRLMELRTGEIRHYQTRRKYIRKDGSTLHSLVYVTAVQHEEGVPTSFGAVLIDISSEINLAQQVRQSHKMEAIGRLAGGIAHDFNNILTVILGASELIGLDPTLSDSVANHLSAIRNAAQRGANLTKQLLTFSRRREPQWQRIHPNRIVHNMEDMLRRLIPEAIQMLVDLDPAPAVIVVDPILLEQVLVNLVVNARDAIPNEGVIGIQTCYRADHGWKAPAEGLHRSCDAFELTVSDTGIGMPSDVLERMFEPFFSTKEVGKGTGLGLAIVHGIVEKFHGEIQVETQVGSGTTFRVFFPIESCEADSEFVPALSSDARGTETILVVDDEPEICRIAQGILEHQGYRVVAVGSPLEALQFFQQNVASVDLVLTDIVMPKMNGVALIQALKGWNPRLKFIMMSGYSEVSLQGLTEDSTTPFLAKPFAQSQLLHAIRSTLNASS